MTLILTFFIFLFGAAIGSFLNVVILRVHQGKKLGGRSQCPYCHHQLSSLDLIPIFSYLQLSGKCRYCAHNLSIQYPLVEFITAVSFSLIFILSPWYQNPSLITLAHLLFSLFICAVLIVVSVYDLRWGLIPDKVIFPASIIALLYQVILNVFLIINYQLLILNFVATLLIGLFFFLLIVGTRGRGMGGGDLKLSLFIGLALGWPLAVLAILLGFLTGALASVMLILLGRKSLKQTVPFGPFLALGTFLALIYGNQILELYLRSMGLN